MLNRFKFDYYFIFEVLYNLIKLSAKPASIIYPYPIAALLAFSVSSDLNVLSLIKAVVFSSTFYAGVNLWNHVNDLEEDIKGGKKTVITENSEYQSNFAYLPAGLYSASILLAFFWSVEIIGFVAFFAAASVTWIYSDRILFGKKIRRWKDHYLTETLSFVVFFPCFFIMLWTIYTSISLKGIGFSLMLTFFMLSGSVLKDIRDITGDKLAGLKTLGVVFLPENLLKTSFLLISIYYFSILLLAIQNILPSQTILSTIFFAGIVYNIKHFVANNWNITLESRKPLTIMYYSNLGSLLALIILGLI
ncbi:MAG: UbiA family prenyltransferase [Halobacteriota archaeon]